MAALAMSGFGEHKSAERWREARQWRVEDIGFRDLEKSWNAIVRLGRRALGSFECQLGAAFTCWSATAAS
jgi:hypothetical protein